MDSALFRGQWPTAPDGFHLIVPVAWDTRAAGPIVTNRNTRLREGSLPAAKAHVGDLVAGGADLPQPLFEAAGPTENGTPVGVAVGVYDLGAPTSDGGLPVILSAGCPGASVEEAVFAYLAGVRFVPPAGAGGDGRRVVSDHWVPVPKRPSQAAVVRFWAQDGTDDDSVAAMNDFMVGGFAFILPGHWLGIQGSATRRMYKPASDETLFRGRWRLSGWRLGSVFVTASMKDDVATCHSSMNSRPQDVFPALGVFLAWFVATIALIGFRNPIMVVGALAFVRAAMTVRKAGQRATIRMAGILVALLLAGLAVE